MGKLGETGVQTFLMLSNSEDTIDRVTVWENDCYLSSDIFCSNNNRGTYQYGISDSESNYPDTPGDGTVVASRARAPLEGKITIGEYNAGGHSSLMKRLRKCVVNALSDNATDANPGCSNDIIQGVQVAGSGAVLKDATVASVSASAAVSPYLYVRVTGNPQPYIINTSGQASGVNVTTGAVEEGIPSTSGLTMIDSGSLIQIDNPSSDVYTLKLKGAASDIYSVNIGYDDGNTISVSKTVNGVYDIGEIVTFTFTLNPASQDVIQINPPTAAPANIQTSNSGGNAILTWTAASGATGYRIYGKRSDYADFQYLGTTTNTQYNTGKEWMDGITGEHWFFIVVAAGQDGSKSFFESSVDNQPAIVSLAVTKSGTGTGTVTGDTGSINCGSVCSDTYISVTPVTLTATPDLAASIFGGWRGDCSSCANTTCQVTMDADKSCEVVFILIDVDGDGIPDSADNCPSVYNTDQLDTDGDKVGDACDNCTLISNPDQRDSNYPEDDNLNKAGIQHYGDVCDPDFDNNGFVNIIDFNEWRKWAGKTIQQGAPAYVDLDGNGTVWIQDFNIWRKYYGKAPGPGIGD